MRCFQKSLRHPEFTPAMKKKSPHSSKQPDEKTALKAALPEINDKVRRLKAKSNHGLYAMALFLAVSIGALQNFEFLPNLSADIRALLGAPPSANMINTALLLYTFSATILILSRMMSGSSNYSGMAHVAYLSAFYLFYHLAGVLEDNFWAAFAAGITILGLESYHIWTFCNEEIRKELEAVADSIRKQRMEQ